MYEINKIERISVKGDIVFDRRDSSNIELCQVSVVRIENEHRNRINIELFVYLDFCHTFVHLFTGKGFRVFVMFIMTIITAVIEIIFGLRAHSQALIADGLYSFAEGLCLIGVMIVLHFSHSEKHRQKRNTFGYERLELLFGLLQEVFLLSISLGIIVDAINHIVNPSHVHEPDLMIYLGLIGMVVGIIGMIMFWGYHHDHDIEEEIVEKKKEDFVSWTKHVHRSKQRKLGKKVLQLNQTSSFESTCECEPEITTTTPENCPLEEFTYENVEIKEHRIYATLHALCLHSFVGFSC